MDLKYVPAIVAQTYLFIYKNLTFTIGRSDLVTCLLLPSHICSSSAKRASGRGMEAPPSYTRISPPDLGGVFTHLVDLLNPVSRGGSCGSAGDEERPLLPPVERRMESPATASSSRRSNGLRKQRPVSTG